ncbi:phytoene/squalene synthase family protein [Nocardia sp. CDC159]|uniref:Phytoene/squalene synthase family protein n=1 Tax=Nocardia pulmonis TaxID=2951408 RepID=A0A9X2E5T3_9NOCA|nr:MULTISPECIES: phytoene/squalene synthase family protein [Nocardia]MCM6773355.1 phytoene/squalene synthase family protein [Nocardia pulmonis]MCM6786242.1 phytoene/squalene synthase family protein [Nocardia sp. CDC159]
MNRADAGGEPAAYRRCARIAAAHGRTYFLAARLLSPERRRAMHALYAFARTVDDIVDGQAEDAAAQLDRIEKDLDERLVAGDPGEPDDPVLFAVSDTILRYEIAREHFRTFLDAMRMDVPGSPLFRNRYATMSELREYMRGSAAAIGLQLLPVLGTVVPIPTAEPAAAALGEAFQLTNFLRDIAEDLDRDRIYLPTEALTAFGVDEPLLHHCHRTAHTDPRLRRALAHLIALNRDLYRTAVPGIDLLHPRVRPAIRTAALLYGEILHEIEHSGYAVFDRRAVVPGHRRLWVAAREFAGARSPRRSGLGAVTTGNK